ncbi:hypothetical protein ACTPOE_17485 [Castellaniella sp. WN]
MAAIMCRDATRVAAIFVLAEKTIRGGDCSGEVRIHPDKKAEFRIDMTTNATETNGIMRPIAKATSCRIGAA